MALKDKIKEIIEVIKETEINEIEITSFWGAQKIKLRKKSDNIIYQESDNTQPPKLKKPTTDTKPLEESPQIKEKAPIEEETEPTVTDTIELDEENIQNDSNLQVQKAPLVGTFYRSSKPDEPSFVEVGDKVTKGQTLCIIEAMKIFNEIESEFDGTIVEILVDDSNPVEFNQAIFSIKPD